MNMNRLLWKETLTQHASPRWPCPSCRTGILKMVPKSLIWKETIKSKRMHGDEDWDPQDFDCVFTAWVKCGSCAQEVAVSGIGGVEPGYDEDGMTWVDFFAPRLLSPMPDMFAIPRKCPDIVSEKLRASFAVFWIDQGAAATRVRVALEKLLDHLGIQKRKKDKNKKLYDLTLHARIEEFGKRDAIIGA